MRPILTPKCLSLFALVGVCLLITACGFKLRNEKPLPPELRVLAVESGTPYGLLTIQLKQLIRSLGVRIATDPTEAQMTLRIFDEAYRTITLSQSASASTKEYTMFFEVQFQLQDTKGKVLFGPRKIVASRNYMVNTDQVLSSTTEQETLQKEMQRDAVYQILNQLSSDDVTALFATDKSAS